MITKEKFDVMLEGWKFIKSATAHPMGYRWITDGKSIFDSEHKIALLKVVEK